MAWANVATNSPIASWLGLSRKNVCTIRGENWPIANCTTTIVIVSTSVASETIDTAIVVKMPIAASGPPDSHRGIRSNPVARSIANVSNDSSRPASTHSTGMNHKLDHTPERRDELMTAACTPRPRPSSGRRRGRGVVEAPPPARRPDVTEDSVVLAPSQATTERLVVGVVRVADVFAILHR